MKILGNILLSERIFYKKQALGAPVQTHTVLLLALKSIIARFSAS